MKNTLIMPLQFAVRIFLIATGVNGVVSTAQIIHDNDPQFFESLHILLFALGISALFFAFVSLIVFFLACLHTKLNHERLFWLIMIIGILLTLVVVTVFREAFSAYEGSTEMFAAIGAFSLMVSLASQYQLFVNYPASGVISGNNRN